MRFLAGSTKTKTHTNFEPKPRFLT